MITTLTLNPSLDYIVTVDHFKVGATNRTSDDFILPGGKGINVSIVLKNLGFENQAYGFLAGFTGKALESMLEEAGVNADFLWVKKATPASTSSSEAMKKRKSTVADRKSPKKIFRS